MEPSSGDQSDSGEENDMDSDERPSEQESGTPQQKQEMQVP
jgi:hypothetical protein